MRNNHGLAEDLDMINQAWKTLQVRADALARKHVSTDCVRNQVTALFLKPGVKETGDAMATMMAIAVERDKLIELITCMAETVQRRKGAQ